jgi:hypothetical protein
MLESITQVGYSDIFFETTQPLICASGKFSRAAILNDSSFVINFFFVRINDPLKPSM